MPKLLQISIEANRNSVGKIAEQIGQAAIDAGWQSHITYSRSHNASTSTLIRIGNKADIAHHVLMTRLTDRHCLYSTSATKKLIEKIKQIDPDIIHLHHIHGYYLDMRVLFDYLSKAGKPVVWTFHDCWSFTGHCCHFYNPDTNEECMKWKTGCADCSAGKSYPATWFGASSTKNYRLKKELFNSVANMVITPVSDWLTQLVKHSFLSSIRTMTIHNGIDLEKFKPESPSTYVTEKYNLSNKYILGVATSWTKHKGLFDIYKLRQLLPDSIDIILVGLTPEQIKDLPSGIRGFNRTDSQTELAMLYTGAEVFINPTYNDTLPTVNIEAQACGTPVVCYNTGGCPETFQDGITGFLIEKGDIQSMADRVTQIIASANSDELSRTCVNHAASCFDRRNNFSKYIDLYNQLLSSNQ